MALVKFGGGIVQMIGSIAGNVFARNSSGNYVRARTKPVNPNSPAQIFARSIIAQLVQHWRTTLDDAERTAWASYAAAVAMKNKLGETTFLSGFNHFIRSNSVFLQSIKAIVEAGPTELSLPEKDPTLAVAADEATGLLTMTIDDTLPWMSEVGAFMQVEMGSPQNATRNFFGGPWKYAGLVDQAAEPVLTITAPYTITNGQRIFISARICRVDGRISEPMYANCIAETP